MSLINFLQKNKIIPTREEVVKNEAIKLAKKICNNKESMINLTNRELGLFNEIFNSEMKKIITERKEKLEQEILDCVNTINKIH